MQTRKRFGRVNVRFDEVSPLGVIDFGKLLRESEPDKPLEDVEEVGGRDVAMAELQPVAIRSDGIEGDDMSDGEDDRGAKKIAKGGRGIFEGIIAKWSSLNTGMGGEDSDEMGGEGAQGLSPDEDEGQDSGAQPVALYLCLHLPQPSSVPLAYPLCFANVLSGLSARVCRCVCRDVFTPTHTLSPTRMCMHMLGSLQTHR